MRPQKVSHRKRTILVQILLYFAVVGIVAAVTNLPNLIETHGLYVIPGTFVVALVLIAPLEIIFWGSWLARRRFKKWWSQQ